MELTGTILSAHVEKRKTKYGEKDYATVAFSDGNTYGTFYNAVATAAEAHAYVGQDGVTIELEKNGDYWNFKGVKSGTTNPTTNGTPAPTASQVPDKRQERIERQTAGKIAATLMAGGFTSDQFEEWKEFTTKIEDHFHGLTTTTEWAS